MAHKIKFVNIKGTDFLSTLKARVDHYFEERNISRHANSWMVVKTIAMISMLLAPYFLILFLDLPLWTMWVLTLIMGFGKAGIGLSIMHDANHGSYSSKTWLNNLIGKSINLVGGHVITWKIQHNILHHTYTNIYEHDEDIETIPLMRFSPDAELKWIHRYQHIFCVFFYGLMTLFWAIHKDYSQLIRYNKMGLLKGSRGSFNGQMIELTVTKILYYVYMLAIPMMLLDISFLQWLVGFMSMHFVAGVVLALIFQTAHVIEETAYPVPNEKHTIENEWAIHQMQTTANFAKENKILSWYCGGLNYQVEHHLFPKICHVHYRGLSEIVKQTAEEFSVPYHSHGTFMNALGSHFRQLKELGRPVRIAA
ncbi:MAG: acyl-CoA desaturase [Flavobacteriales bacterium]|nr:acyl-CoA desaturase [Flavobacteriales bacterium]